MIEKSCQITNLPIGTGSAIGSFIRSLYLTASTRYAIIGIDVKGLSFFDTLGANSAMVSDLISLLISEDYTINPNVITDAHKVTDHTSLGAVYSVHSNNSFSKEITRQQFSSIIEGDSTMSIKLLTPVTLDVTFYICEVVGIAKENLVSAVLHELPIDTTSVLPISCTGKHVSKVWSTYDQHKFNEDLTLHISGPNEDAVNSDIAFLKNLYSSYVIKALDGIENFK